MGSRPPRIYFDADALITGAYSPTGGAGALLLAAEKGLIIAIVSPQVLEETRRNLTKKLPQALPELENLLVRVPFERVGQPSDEGRRACLHLADAKDAAHVAAAHQARAAYLVTFNLKDYHQEQIRGKVGITVLKPGDLLAELRAQGILPPNEWPEQD